ncbi:GNAT family N-acetyltransferase [Derxia gummosa]|uniref:GNAT family N-acetyltransferase n=1 Tax=Derxia gummosa DSM 723 TaxID=1121388 RepID=A0A8B6XCL7_9BURK|nr:GNAT family N-acetyltransferase [Derxia gummosa]
MLSIESVALADDIVFAHSLCSETPPLNGLVARPATDADLPFLAALYASLRAREVAATGWTPARQQAFLADQFLCQHRYYHAHFGDAAFLMLERGSQPIGRLYARIHDGVLTLIDISLIAPARGQGLGGALLGRLSALADDAGLEMSLAVEPDNPARRLYERHGFAPHDDSGFYLRMLRAARRAPTNAPARPA